MIRSMTGYGDAELDCTAGRLRLEVKTVNHRFFNANIKTPSGFDRFEKAISDALRAQLTRGHVSAYLTIDRSVATVEHGPSVDVEKARGYMEALETLKEEFDLPGEPDLAMLVRFSDVFRAPEIDRTAGVEPEMIVAIADQAATACRSMREAEGLRLADDLEERLTAISAQLDTVERRVRKARED